MERGQGKPSPYESRSLQPRRIVLRRYAAVQDPAIWAKPMMTFCLLCRRALQPISYPQEIAGRNYKILSYS